MTSARWQLPDDLAAASIARRHASTWAVDAGWDLDETDDLVLVVSELVANGIRHGRPPVTLTLEPTPDGGVLVLVGDTGSGVEPAARTADHDEGHGRGLAMVDALSTATGWGRDGGVTVVWAHVPRGTT